MIEYWVTGISGTDADLACRLLAAALKQEPLARQALADLLAEHGQELLASMVRDESNALVQLGEGSIDVVPVEEDYDGEIRYVWQVGCHLPTTKSYQRLLDGDMPLVVHEPSPLDNAF